LLQLQSSRQSGELRWKIEELALLNRHQGFYSLNRASQRLYRADLLSLFQWLRSVLHDSSPLRDLSPKRSRSIEAIGSPIDFDGSPGHISLQTGILYKGWLAEMRAEPRVCVEKFLKS
jgi:hypothetical protein